MPARHLLSLAAASEYLGVTERSLHRWITSGQLRAYKLGPRVVRIDLADLDALLTPIT